MKVMLSLFAAFGLMAANDQTEPAGESMDARTIRRMQDVNVSIRLEAPNELTTGNLSLDGVAVQAIRTEHPLQLVNPFALPEYGSGEANVDWDPISGKASGLKIFSIKF